ncbi:MAG: hypothetical protein ACN6O6_23145 [Pseudomonas sp.]|uniref:hypothetical protein n=1 Tax=Pseudomonas sp. TaxID=306 RepID=UPI003D10327A
MHSECNVVTPSLAPDYMGKLVLMELVWPDDPDPLWCLFHVVGFVLPVEGVYPHGYFLILSPTGDMTYPEEIFFSNIRTISAMRHRERHGSGNVPGRMTLTHSNGSRAALPARRNSSTVLSNGITAQRTFDPGQS